MTHTFRFQGQIYKIELMENEGQVKAEINGEEIPLEFQKIEDNLYLVLLNGRSLIIGVLKNQQHVQVFLDGDLFELESISEREKRQSSQLSLGVQEIKSPMPSRVVKMLKKEGDEVKSDDGLVVVEAMKMESELKSSINGKVTSVMVSEGDVVEAGTVLLVVSSE